MCDSDTKSYHIEDLRRVVNWYDSLPIGTFYASRIKIKTAETGLGTAVTAFVETSKGEGLWKDLSDYENW